MKVISLAIILLAFTSCSSQKNASVRKLTKLGKSEYELTDGTGTYRMTREIILSKKNQYSLETRIFPLGQENRPLEVSKVTSLIGRLKSKNGNSRLATRPETSQYQVWLEGKKYISQMKTQAKKRGMEVNLKSPRDEWSGKRFQRFPRKSGPFCFMSQVIECLKINQAFAKFLDKKTRAIRFVVVWDTYPYISGQLNNLPEKVFSDAIFQYEGRDEKTGFQKFTLDIEGHSIFYHLDKDYNFSQLFWISQGISIRKL